MIHEEATSPPYDPEANVVTDSDRSAQQDAGVQVGAGVDRSLRLYAPPHMCSASGRFHLPLVRKSSAE